MWVFFFMTAVVATCPPNMSYSVVYFEDFLGDTLNETAWETKNNQSHCSPCEDANYMTKNVQVNNSLLTLTTVREKSVGTGGIVYNFTSGWVIGKNTNAWFHGKYEVSARLPPRNATGVWPAHWLLPVTQSCWPLGGEIDIMEYTANPLTNNVYGSYRWGTVCDQDMQILPGAGYPSSGAANIDWSIAFHTFAVEWNATAMAFSVDGNVYEVKTPDQVIFPTEPMYWILDSAIAWYWPPSPEAVYPCTHDIDWVRVSQCK